MKQQCHVKANWARGFFALVVTSVAAVGIAGQGFFVAGEKPLKGTAEVVFKGAKLDELKGCEFWAKPHGGWVSPVEARMLRSREVQGVAADGKAPARLVVQFQLPYEKVAQKSVAVEFTEAKEGVAARILAARYLDAEKATPEFRACRIANGKEVSLQGKGVAIAVGENDLGYGLHGLMATRDEAQHFTPAADVVSGPEAGMESARAVIERFAGKATSDQLKLERIPAANGCPAYEILDDGRTIRASSPFAACRGFYASVKQSGAGIRAWTGKRFDSAKWHSPDTRVVSPFKYHNYLNAVIYAYTVPYWDEARWFDEIDWMALHGVDMPLLLMAYEPIFARTLKRLGLNDAEVAAFFPGPAHLPFLRMGELQGEPDRLNPKWMARAIRIQHAVMRRLKELGMTPICPAFGGAVPKALERVHPEAKLLPMMWAGYHSYILSPEQPLFREVERTFIEEWEKEFGACEFYLADSFNEMKVPWKTPEEVRRNLAACGENIYGGMKDASPKATWVFQGWLFVNDPEFWSRENLQALVSKVPDGRSMVIDLAVDYMKHYRKMDMNWNKFAGYPQQQWVYSYTPNMGGRRDFHFPFDTYANQHLQALGSENRGKLAGYGFAPEGIELDEPMFELITDAGWSSHPIEPMEWLKQYSVARYGSCPKALENFWQEMLAGPFTTLCDYKYTWQYRHYWNKDSLPKWSREYNRGLHWLREAGKELGGSELYRADLIEIQALCDARLVETLLAMGRHTEAIDLLRKVDELLAKHPLHRLDRWLEQARRAAEGDPRLEREYVENARRIVTWWIDPKNGHGWALCDYSYRLWNGLIKEWYIPRLERSLGK